MHSLSIYLLSKISSRFLYEIAHSIEILLPCAKFDVTCLVVYHMCAHVRAYNTCMHTYIHASSFSFIGISPTPTRMLLWFCSTISLCIYEYTCIHSTNTCRFCMINYRFLWLETYIYIAMFVLTHLCSYEFRLLNRDSSAYARTFTWI